MRLADGARMAIVAALLAATVAAVVVWVLVRPTRGRGRGRPWTGPAILCGQVASDHVSIVWRGLGGDDPRTVYRSAAVRWGHAVPDEFGFLPSADGRWVVVWETKFRKETREALRTKWLVVSLPAGRRYRLGETFGGARLLPAWDDRAGLVLVGKGGEFRWDPEEGPPRGTLPAAIPATDAQVALLSYCARYYPRAGSYMRAALSKFQQRVRIPGDRDDQKFHRLQPPEYAVLRSSGIPGMTELRFLLDYPAYAQSMRRFPYAAFTRDGHQFAYAYVGRPALRRQETAGEQATASGPRGGLIRVYSVASGEVVWTMDRPSEYRPERSPPWMKTNPPTGPWTYVAVRDPRWSQDEKYFSFTLQEELREHVVVLETSGWREVVRIPDAANGFVLSQGPAGTASSR